MSNIVFQRPRGTSWQAKWTDAFSTLVQSGTAPGFETRVSMGLDQLRTLELNYAILTAGSKGETRDQLMGFFNLRGGDFDSFLVDLGALTKNPVDSSIVGQTLTPDANKFAPLQLTHYVSPQENWMEDIYEVGGINGNPGTPPTIKQNGIPLVLNTDYYIYGPGYSVSGKTFPGLVIFIATALSTSPISHITADFSWYYRVRFEQSKLEVEMFHWLAWKAQQIRLVTVRT